MEFQGIVAFVGPDKKFAIDLIKITANLEIPILGVVGENAQSIMKEMFSSSNSAEINILKNIEVITDNDFWNNQKFIKLLKLKPLGVNFGFTRLISSDVLALIQILNLHPSYLPKLRGSHHSFYAILDGEPVGGTLHWMNDKLDAGPIIDQVKYEVKELDTAEEVQEQCHLILYQLYQKNILRILKSQILTRNQDHQASSIHYKSEIKEKTTLKIKDSINVEKLLKLIRAVKHRNGSFYIQTEENEVQIKICEFNVSSIADKKFR